MRVKLPPVLAIDENLNGNTIQQLITPSCTIEANVASYQNPQFKLKGKVIAPSDGEGETLIIEKPSQFPDSFSKVISTKLNGLKDTDADFSSGKWLKHPLLADREEVTPKKQHEDVIASWEHAFSYLREEPERNIKGLRPPQIGAIHAVHQHWTVSDEVGTVVMPTGTGKTEAMLSVLISIPCHKILIIVPTDALRTQIANKFLTLGILKDVDCRILKEGALFPIVGVLRHIPKDVDEVDAFFEKCHAVVTTSSIAGQCSGELQQRIASHCPFLFIDEAHHSEAPTWSAFKGKFALQRVLQFTATPFREDGKLLDGKIIYTYPLKKAQEEGYFKPIQFKPVSVFELAKADEAIAEKAVQQLREDAAHNHILMARVGTIDRAKKVFSIYEKYEEFNPVQIHTGIKSAKEREKIRQKILSGESKIVVCVDMLGEGFDLPELKIAAFHDIKKSLAVTLQLAGRFTRSRPDLGQATFIANIADVSVRDELRKLYSRDPDWNALLPELSDELVEEQVNLKEFIDGFANFPADIPLKSIRPAMSTVVYKTKCASWNPENFRKGIPGISTFERVHHDINHKKNSLIVVTARKIPIEWANIKDIFNWDWELYLLFWDEQQKLLFIHNSHKNGYFKNLAKAVAGDDVEMLNEQMVFRCFSGVNRLRLQNVGLSEHFGGLNRYTGRMGSHVGPVITEAQKENTLKAVLFGTGYENGRKVTIGASRGGRIWSFLEANVESWTRWCSSIGAKLLNTAIDPDEVLKGTLESQVVSERPQKMPVTIDWPEKIYTAPETAHSFFFEDDTELLLLHTDIVLEDPAETGDIKFLIASEDTSIEVTLTLLKKGKTPDRRFSVKADKKVRINHGSDLIPLEEFFHRHPPMIWFVDGSSLEGNKFTQLKKMYAPYDREKIQAWDWKGVDLTKESQGVTRKTDSIQFKVIQELKKRDYQLIFDDDDSGEAADIVTVRIVEERKGQKALDVEFYHCKFTKAKPGERIKDMYEVCGQAQKSLRWMRDHDKQIELFTHMLRREPRKKKKSGLEGTRFERGTFDELLAIREMARIYPMRLKIFIVQPGLSKTNATQDQLELLSVTENHLMETFKLPFEVIANS